MFNSKKVNKKKVKIKREAKIKKSIFNEVKIELKSNGVSKSEPPSEITVTIHRVALKKSNEKDRSLELKKNNATPLAIMPMGIKIRDKSETSSSFKDVDKRLKPRKLVHDGNIDALQKFFAFKAKEIDPVSFVQSKRFGTHQRSLLHIAVLKNHIEIVEYFYKLGIDLMEVRCDKNGETPWHYLAKKFDKKVFLTLILFKNSFETLELKNKNDETPYEYARRCVEAYRAECRTEFEAKVKAEELLEESEMSIYSKEYIAECMEKCDQKQFISAVKDAYIDAHIYNDKMDYLLQIKIKKSKKYERSESLLSLTDVKELVETYSLKPSSKSSLE